MTAYAPSEAPLADSIGAVERPRSEHATWLMVAAPAVAFVAQVAATDAYYTTLTKVYSGLLAALTAFVLVRCAITRPQRLPAIEYALFLHYMAFGLAATLGALSVGVAGYTPLPEAFEAAAGLAVVSALAMLAGHAVWSLSPRLDARRKYLPNLSPDVIDAASGPYVLVAATFVVARAVVPSLAVRLGTVLAIILLFLDLVPLVTVATIAYALRRRTRTLGQLVIAVGASLVVFVGSSVIGLVLVPAVAISTVWWRLRGKIPVVLGVAAIAFLYVLQPVKSYYREIMWGDRSQEVSVVAGWERAFANANADRNKASGSDATRERLSELATLAYVTELVPSSMPYIGGEAYEETAIAMVPRVLWPDKPNMTKTGLDRYTIALGLTSRDTAEHSTTGIQLVTHGYMSHGVVGGVGWMALLGFVIGALNRFFGGGIAGTVAMSMCIGWIPGMGAGFVTCFGSLWQVIIGSLALVWALWALGRFVQLATAKGPLTRSRHV